MAVGAGKYDAQLTVALELLLPGPAGPPTGVLVILNGPKGPGFSCQCTRDELAVVPAILRKLAADIEADFRGSLTQ